MSPNASHRVRPGLSSAASLITTLLISFDQEVLNQHLNLVTPEYPFFESPWRPAGVLIPEGAGQRSLQAGFGQIEGQVMEVGMAAEVTCVSKPMTIIPMVVTDVQDFIAAGQFRGGEQLVDPQQVTRPGTILVFLEPLYEGGLDGVLPGSSCIANAYTSNHDVIASKDISTTRRIVLHAVDAVGLVHAMILRIQALVLPIQTLVFSGH